MRETELDVCGSFNTNVNIYAILSCMRVPL